MCWYSLAGGRTERTTSFCIRHIEIRDEEYASILEVEGPIDATTEVAFRAELDALIRSGARHIILDCKNVPYINSTGLGTILSFMDRVEELGGNLLLANPSDKALMVIEMLGFASVLAVVGDESEAMDRLAAAE